MKSLLAALHPTSLALAAGLKPLPATLMRTPLNLETRSSVLSLDPPSATIISSILFDSSDVRHWRIVSSLLNVGTTAVTLIILTPQTGKSLQSANIFHKM